MKKMYEHEEEKYLSEILLERLEKCENYLGTKELMEVLGKSYPTIIRLMNSGKIKFYMCSKIYYLKKSDVKEYIRWRYE